jgi:nucleoid-associated protein YgaU
MRTEIKAAIVVGLVVFVGAVIWAVNSGRKADNIPYDLTPGQATPQGDIELAGDETIVPDEAVAADQQAAADTRTEEPPVLSYEPVVTRQGVAPSPDAAAETGKSSEVSLTASAPATRPPVQEKPVPHVGPGPTVAETDRPRPDAARETAELGEQDMSSRLEGLRKSAAGASAYTIQRGDTFISIAREHYGEDRFYMVIQEANPDLDARSLQPGQVIVLPPREQAIRARLVPKTKEIARETDEAIYVVGKGDTLIRIARNVLKDESRYMEIFRLNRDKLESPDLVIEGMKLRLPPLKKKTSDAEDAADDPASGD